MKKLMIGLFGVTFGLTLLHSDPKLYGLSILIVCVSGLLMKNQLRKVV